MLGDVTLRSFPEAAAMSKTSLLPPLMTFHYAPFVLLDIVLRVDSDSEGEGEEM